ncbi:30S ribosomal protein S6 [Desulfuromonas carbonis]|uniref:30S ribosomal protein S6 n=1 Tax=Desulfuromonas sp. DDH964 TaxID=1823759 RepID=UPI00078E0962|nr:30S ribosomal protein S6 [Desulfuromonas sp. DDH964]AMV71657.1 30S ribosomal protein S6 [Desulfuromonas sp. DDH964]
MRTYETIFIVHPDVAGEAYTAAVDKFKGILTDQGAEILKADEWGTRKLAYPVKKQTRGSYVLVAYEAGPKVVAELERRMRIDDAIIKFQTVYLENGLQIEAAPVAEAPAPAAEDADATSDEAAE